MPRITIEELLRLSPRILGTIRWKRSIGSPRGPFCAAFDIRVEEHTATEYRDVGGGHYAPEPGTGIWKTVPEGLTCRAIDEVGSDPFVSFQVAGLHLNAPLDGCYRVTPRLKGPWHPAGKLASLSYRSIEPISASVALKKERPVQSVSFEVIRRSVLTGRRLD